MRDPQRNTKATTPFNQYKPSLDTLEDRSLPGNALIGLAGLSMPFAAAAQKALATLTTKIGSPAAKAATKSTATSVSQLSITASKVMTAFSGGKQTVQSDTALAAIKQIESSLSSNTGAIKSDISESWESILNRMVNAARNSQNGSTISDSSSMLKAGTSSLVIESASASSGTISSRGIISTEGTVKPTRYDAETQARLKEYAHEGTLDLRGLGQVKLNLSDAQLAAAGALKAQMPELQYRVNTDVGSPKMVYNLDGYLTGPQAGSASSIAINYLQANAAFFGVQQSDINSLTVNKSYADSGLATTSAKLSYVYLQQKVAGIPVFGMTNVSVLGDGKVVSVANGMQPNLLASVNTTTPTITAATAVQSIAANLGLTVKSPITNVTPESGAVRSGAYSDGGFARQAIKTDLSLVPTTNGVRLAWHALVYLKNDYLFEFYVDATNGSVLLRNSLTHFDSYRVLPFPVKAPDQGSIVTVTNPADPVASPFGWHDINGKPGADYFITRGNNVSAKTRRDSSLVPGTPGSQVVPTGGPTNTYNYIADFKQDPSTYQAAAAVNLFYATNMIHDVSYRYGFTEMAANFQQNNYGRGGVGNDQVLAFAQDDADLGATDNAFFSSGPEGTSGEVHMFVWDLTGPQADGDFANEIVAHEIGHGIQSRLVGGGNVFALGGVQGEALNEGGADFNALFFTTGLAQANNFNGRTPSGTYVLGLPPSGKTPAGDFGGGLRRLPYSSNDTINALTYNDIDPNQIDVTFPPGYPFDASQVPPDESHNAGEVWANTLFEMMGNLVATNGFSSNLATGTAGNNIAYQLYITGLKLTAAIPSFLDARDGIVSADLALYGGAHLEQIWSAFAHRGMGILATDGGIDSVNVVEDFTIPDDIEPPVPPPPPSGGNGSKDALYEPNETSNTAFNLGAVTGVNDLKDLQIKLPIAGKAGDRDWFKFTPTKAGTLTLTADVATSTGDLDLRLYRSKTGSPTTLTEIGVGQGTHRSSGTDETITVAVGAGITYYFNVAGFNKSSGNYNLVIDAPA